MMNEVDGTMIAGPDLTPKYAGAIAIGAILALIFIRVVLERK